MRSRAKIDDESWRWLSQDGVASRNQLYAAGFTRAQIRHRVASGRWDEALPGAYLLNPTPATPLQRILLAIAWSQGTAYACGPSAAWANGLKGYRSEQVHVLFVGPGAKQSPATWITVHRTPMVLARDLRPRLTPRRTSPARSVVETASLAKRSRDASAVLAAGVQQRLCSAAELKAVVEGLPRVRHRAEMLTALVDIGGGSDSLPEREFLQLCRRFGLPMPTRQSVRSIGGRRRYLDTEWEEWGVAAEIDGRFHTEVAHWVSDMERGNELVASGLLLLRFPAWMIRHEPRTVARSIEAALVSRGWRRS